MCRLFYVYTMREVLYYDITSISLCAHSVSGLICDVERIATWIIYLVLADPCM